ncbi:glycosyltransferase [Nocardioides sp. YIM 152315]|uniref:glycosyltransferase n=1 Tax=Nocardioides sp. YIM 152315 TaxID=3031760 RepID=UPI0023DCC208|nr:glycosyltransferase [Nocardioides sp. YIM 152315]MDF1604956.1 glycosyltransferase [Nocardioides sp. YIM 152315]
MSTQPRVSANDWRVLDPPALGAWRPSLSVTVVIPAYRPHRLPLVLAALAAQSYPDHLLEVVVVDDHSDPPVELPEVRPANTRLLTTEHRWSKSNTCRTGIDRSDGDVIHFLDSDMVPAHREVEAHLRWHHVVDYAAVLGFRTFVPEDALDHLTPTALHDHVAAGTDLHTLVVGDQVPQEWTERILAETDGLAAAGPRAMRLHVGASTSVTRALASSSAGLPPELDLGEDIVFGYRLREAGAVFVPDRAAVSIHLGQSSVMSRTAQVNRFNHPHFAQLVPEFRGHRRAVSRSYAVPYAEVVLPVAGATAEEVCAVVDTQLASTLPDLVVTLVGSWADPTTRGPVLDDPALEQRLVRTTYEHEPRVRLVSEPAPRSDATFRVTLPGTGAFPAGKALAQLLRRMELEHLGCVDVDLPDGSVARVVRTQAHARALRTCADRSEYDDALAACYPATRESAARAGFVTDDEAPPVKQVRGLVGWGVGRADRD